MDIKAMAQELTEKVKNDKDFKANFEKDPVKAIESVVGVDIPDDVVNQVLNAVKGNKIADSVAGAADKLKGLF